MTNYYYLASDQKKGLGNGSVDFSHMHMIAGFDYPRREPENKFLRNRRDL